MLFRSHAPKLSFLLSSLLFVDLGSLQTVEALYPGDLRDKIRIRVRLWQILKGPPFKMTKHVFNSRMRKRHITEGLQDKR